MIVNLSEDKRFFVIESCTQEEYDQLKCAYTKKPDGYRFNPMYKKGLWDGTISFVKGANIPSGTWSYLMDTSNTCNWDIKLNGISKLVDTSITLEGFTNWCNTFFADLEFKPRDYQIEAAYNILRFKKCLSELATSAGKTLICFMVITYLVDNKIINNKVLMIVPTIQLVLQSFGDFMKYNTDKLPLNIQQAYAGFKDNPNANITVGTFQTLTKLSHEWFKQFECVIVDECLHPDTDIMMANNTYKKIKDVVEGDKVFTYNEEKNIIEIKEVEYVHKNLSSHDFLYELEMKNGQKISLTGNHKVLLTNGIYKRVDELCENDDIFMF